MFKNIRVYEHNYNDDAPRRVSITDADLEPVLFTDRRPTELATVGFVPVDDRLVVPCGPELQLMRVRVDEALLPAKVIAQEVQRRIAKLTYQPKRSEVAAIKEDAVHALLPKAFTVTSMTNLYYDSGRGWYVIDTASASAAEGVLALLRTAFESLPVAPLHPGDFDPRHLMTQWLTAPDTLPKTMGLGWAATMESREDKASVALKHHDLTGAEVASHLNSGKLCTSLALELTDICDYMLKSDYSLSKFHLADTLEGLDDVESIDGSILLIGHAVREAYDGLVAATPKLDKADEAA